MERVNVVLDRDQIAFVEREAARIGRPRTEIIRKAIDDLHRRASARFSKTEDRLMPKNDFDEDAPLYSESSGTKGKKGGGVTKAPKLVTPKASIAKASAGGKGGGSKFKAPKPGKISPAQSRQAASTSKASRSFRPRRSPLLVVFEGSQV